ncbi:Fic family protein [Humisphaera borealis]|uniref:Fic family protein n=1 Tax=Humisphaera borealis TaxID=2807512 RepID=UPI001F14FE1D|nr:hypothetical protein [Humisphaera borealis]
MALLEDYPRSLLYLSGFFKRNRSEYYERLQGVRDKGDWQGWLRFFLDGVRTVSAEASDTARKIQEMREQHRALLADQTGGLAVLDRLFARPMITVNQVRDTIGMTYPVAAELVRLMEANDLLTETTGRTRNRVFAYRPYLTLLGESSSAKPMDY